MTSFVNSNSILDQGRLTDLEDLLQKQSQLVDNLQSELNGVNGTMIKFDSFQSSTNSPSFLKSHVSSKTIDKVLNLDAAKNEKLLGCSAPSNPTKIIPQEEEDAILKLLDQHDEETNQPVEKTLDLTLSTENSNGLLSSNVFSNAFDEGIISSLCSQEDSSFDLNSFDFEPRPIRQSASRDDSLLSSSPLTPSPQELSSPVHTMDGKSVVTDEDSTASSTVNEFQDQASALEAAFDKSVESQDKLIAWDRKMGLKRCHCRTMVKTLKSRKKLREALAELTGVSLEEDKKEESAATSSTESRPTKKSKR